MASMDRIVIPPENSSKTTPGTRPVREKAYGRESAPAPRVALQRLEMAPGGGQDGFDGTVSGWLLFLGRMEAEFVDELSEERSL